MKPGLIGSLVNPDLLTTDVNIDIKKREAVFEEGGGDRWAC